MPRTNRSLFNTTPVAIYLLIIMWVVFAIEAITPFSFTHWGIMPRSLEGLIGIAFAPLLHGSLWHLISNSIPFAILGTLIQLNPRNNIWDVIVLGTIITGLGVWLIGNTAYHVGASGLVMVFWAYLIADGWFTRSLRSLLLAAITVIFYGWMIYVIFDMRAHISWSSHVIGAFAGVVIAWLSMHSKKRKER